MGFSLKKSFGGSSGLGSLAGAALGGFFGGPAGAAAGSQIGGALFGGSDDMSAMDIYKMQRADALSDWNRQNAYNDPSAQMQRLVASGLNPYLVYSGGNVTGNSSSGIDQVTYKPQTVDNFSSTLTKALQNLNYRSMKADTKGKEIDTEMRELDLALKKAKIAQLATGRQVNVTKPRSINDQRNEIKLRNEIYADEYPAFANAENANLLGFKPGKWSSDLVNWITTKYLNARDYYDKNATGYLRYFR